MQVVIYIEENFRAYDLALALEMFSEENGFELILTGKDSDKIKSENGLEISVKQGILTVPRADVLIILGGKEVESPFLGLSDYIYKHALTLRAIVAIGRATTFVARSGLFQQNEFTMPIAAYKKYKKMKLNYQAQPLLVSENLITAVLPIYTISAYCKALELVACDASKILQQYGLSLPILPDTKIYKKAEKSFNKEQNSYLKKLEQKKRGKQRAGFYIYDDVNPLDILFLDNILGHLPYEVNYIADRTGAIYTAYGLKIYAPQAIQNIMETDLLIIPSGKGIERCMVSAFLTHWLNKIAPLSYRVLSIGEGEKLLGVSEALIDVDLDYLATLALGEGKFLMTKDVATAVKAIEIFSGKENKFKAENIKKYYSF